MGNKIKTLEQKELQKKSFAFFLTNEKKKKEKKMELDQGILNIQQLIRELTDVGGAGEGDIENFDHVSYILKQVYESGKETVFMEALDNYNAKKKNEIEKVCSLHYQVSFLKRKNFILKGIRSIH